MIRQFTCILMATASLLPIAAAACVLYIDEINLALLIGEQEFAIGLYAIFALIPPALSILLFWAWVSRPKVRQLKIHAPEIVAPQPTLNVVAPPRNPPPASSRQIPTPPPVTRQVISIPVSVSKPAPRESSMIVIHADDRKLKPRSEIVSMPVIETDLAEKKWR